VVRPDPIPNSAVKHSLADGSGFIDSARVGSRQFFEQKPEHLVLRLFVFCRLLVCLRGILREIYFQPSVNALNDLPFIFSAASHQPCSLSEGLKILIGGMRPDGRSANVKSVRPSGPWQVAQREPSEIAMGAPALVGEAKP
jgi:hypothetical protein